MKREEILVTRRYEDPVGRQVFLYPEGGCKLVIWNNVFFMIISEESAADANCGQCQDGNGYCSGVAVLCQVED